MSMAGYNIHNKAKIKDDTLHYVVLKSFFNLNLIEALLIFKLTVKRFLETSSKLSESHISSSICKNNTVVLKQSKVTRIIITIMQTLRK